MERYSASLPFMLLVLILMLSLFGCKDEPIMVDEPIPFSRLLENQKMSSQIFKVDINYAVLLPEAMNPLTTILLSTYCMALEIMRRHGTPVAVSSTIQISTMIK
jgi:hypothetical protein